LKGLYTQKKSNWREAQDRNLRRLRCFFFLRQKPVATLELVKVRDEISGKVRWLDCAHAVLYPCSGSCPLSFTRGGCLRQAHNFLTSLDPVLLIRGQQERLSTHFFSTSYTLGLPVNIKKVQPKATISFLLPYIVNCTLPWDPPGQPLLTWAA
jgi:hypothetical protein